MVGATAAAGAAMAKAIKATGQARVATARDRAEAALVVAALEAAVGGPAAAEAAAKRYASGPAKTGVGARERRLTARSWTPCVIARP